MTMTQTITTKAIQLNEQEQQLADLLVECADWIDHHPAEVDALRVRDERGEWIGQARTDEPVQLRMAGGWVRDKVLAALCVWCSLLLIMTESCSVSTRAISTSRRRQTR